MRQRVSLARTLAYEPDVILMDEPFAALDAFNRTALQEEILRINDKTRLTVLFITHDLSEALVLGTQSCGDVQPARPGYRYLSGGPAGTALGGQAPRH